MVLNLLSLSALGSSFLPIAACLVASPNASIPTQWTHSFLATWDFTVIRSERETPDYSLTGYKNWALDQVIDGEGTINVCMRWGSNKTLTETARKNIETQYKDTYGQWFQWLPGYNNFPYMKINFKVVGWAATDNSLLENYNESIPVYTDFTHPYDGFPTCDPRCSQNQHPDGDFSECPGGLEARYHQFFLLDPSYGQMDMGSANGEGTRISLWGWETIGSKLGRWPMLLHELGHTFGFLDFLDDGLKNHSICENVWIPPNAPAEFVMKPGDYGAHVPTLTEFEGWLLRYWWTRFSNIRRWQMSNITFAPPPACPVDLSNSLHKRKALSANNSHKLVA